MKTITTKAVQIVAPPRPWLLGFARLDKFVNHNYNSGMMNYGFRKFFAFKRHAELQTCHAELAICHPELGSASKNIRFRNKFKMTKMELYCREMHACHPELGSGSKYKFAQNFKKFAAFTLAEVLITLGVIGVVAALTIPTLLSNYKSRTWSTAATVFERRFEEALKVMNVSDTLEGYQSTKDFVSELNKHLKINKICNNVTDCFADRIGWEILDISKGTTFEEIDLSNITSAAGLGHNDWNTEALGFQLNNGATGIIAYNPNCKGNKYDNQFIGTECIAVVYDTSGFSKPNTYNKDVRGINANITGNCLFKSDNTCFGVPFKATRGATKQECIEVTGDENNCPLETDYWAGAMLTCKEQGGTLPTMLQAYAIARYAFNKPGTDLSTIRGERNCDLLIKLGFSDCNNDLGGSNQTFIMTNYAGSTFYNIWMTSSLAQPLNSQRGSYNNFVRNKLHWAVCVK